MFPIQLISLAQQAQQAPTPEAIWTPSNIMTAILGLTVAVAALGGVVAVLARGFWSKTIEPMLQATIINWFSSEAQVNARKRETEAAITNWYGQSAQLANRSLETVQSVTAWHNAPEQLKTRKELIYAEIDNHVRRDDGLINREIKVSVERGVGPLLNDMADIKTMLRNRETEDHAFKQEVISTLSRLTALMEGSALRADTPLFTQRKPLVPGVPKSQDRPTLPGAPKQEPPR